MISGRCLCGAVSYQSAGPAVLQFNCHCRDCQRSTGAAYAPVMFLRKEGFHIQGPLSHFDSVAASGKTLRRSFCSTCGAQILGAPESVPPFISIRAGTLDDPSLFKPSADIFCSQAAPWDCMNPELLKFPAMLPAPNGQ